MFGQATEKPEDPLLIPLNNLCASGGTSLLRTHYEYPLLPDVRILTHRRDSETL